MNNLLPYYGLTDSRMSASDEDLPVPHSLLQTKCLEITVFPKIKILNGFFLSWKKKQLTIPLNKLPGADGKTAVAPTEAAMLPSLLSLLRDHSYIK